MSWTLLELRKQEHNRIRVGCVRVHFQGKNGRELASRLFFVFCFFLFCFFTLENCVGTTASAVVETPVAQTLACYGAPRACERGGRKHTKISGPGRPGRGGGRAAGSQTLASQEYAPWLRHPVIVCPLAAP